MSESKHRTRDFNNSEFTKTIGIKLEKFDLIERVRDKKSRAGKLDEIIEFWKNNHPSL